jgi:magnesium and cobalt transporter
VESALELSGYNNGNKSADEDPLRMLSVDDVFIPRADIIAFDQTTPIQQIIDHFLNDGHSFYPIYEETLDEVAGYVDSTVIMRTMLADRTVIPKAVLKQPIFIVATTRLTDLLLEMRQKKTYLAIVIDEYGGVDGLVTLHDVLESVVTDIAKGGDEGQNNIIAQDDGGYLINARTTIEEFSQYFDIELKFDEDDQEKIDTVAGWLVYNTGYLPDEGEVIKIDGYAIFIKEATPRQLIWLKINNIHKREN